MRFPRLPSLRPPFPRPFSTSPFASSSKWSIQVIPPDPIVVQKQAEENGMEVDLVPLEEAVLHVSESAWERLTAIAQREKDPTLVFRVAVDSGGCHGYQYKMDLTNDKELDDYMFNPTSNFDGPITTTSTSTPSAKPLGIVIDPPSLKLLKGSTLDYTTELIGSAFRIKENPQAKGSGCGCGVSWEAV